MALIGYTCTQPEVSSLVSYIYPGVLYRWTLFVKILSPVPLLPKTAVCQGGGCTDLYSMHAWTRLAPTVHPPHVPGPRAHTDTLPPTHPTPLYYYSCCHPLPPPAPLPPAHSPILPAWPELYKAYYLQSQKGRGAGACRSCWGTICNSSSGGSRHSSSSSNAKQAADAGRTLHGRSTDADTEREKRSLCDIGFFFLWVGGLCALTRISGHYVYCHQHPAASGADH